MKILITGGSGYIGTQLVHQLSRLPQVTELIVYDNLARKNFNLFISHQKLPDKITFIHGDILDSRKLKKVLKEVDTVIHCAAKVSTPFASEDSHRFEQINHWGTAELCYAIEESAVERLIYLSSTSVYGSHEEAVHIDSTPQPKTFYGISKLRGEQHVQRLSEKLQTHILRCGNVYGYNRSMRFDAVINRFMFEANFTGRVAIHGNGKQKRAFIHVQKVASAIEQILTEKISSGIYNLADRNISILELTGVVKEIYPDLEFVFIDQHMQMRNLQVLPDERLSQLFQKRTLKEELEEFAGHFAFHSSAMAGVM